MLAGMKTPEKQPLAKEADKFIVRLPEGMRNRIEEAAKANKRSMNAEIVARLQFSFEAQSGPPDLDDFADQLAEKLAKRLKGK
jgi:predicted HicB family RNase H-like nuclease